MTVRDYSGRYAWDSKIEYDWPTQQLAAKKKAADSRNAEGSFNPNNMPEGSFEDRRDSEDVPPFTGAEPEDTGVNDLDGLLKQYVCLSTLVALCFMTDSFTRDQLEREPARLRQRRWASRVGPTLPTSRSRDSQRAGS